MTEVKEKVKKYKFPKAVGACADKLYQLREERLKQQKIVDDIEAEEKALKAHIINTLPKSEASGVSGKIAKVKVETDDIPQTEDWDKVWQYIKKNNAFDLLQRRLNNAAVEERWEAGKKIPGIKTFKVVKVSCTKV